MSQFNFSRIEGTYKYGPIPEEIFILLTLTVKAFVIISLTALFLIITVNNIKICFISKGFRKMSS